MNERRRRLLATTGIVLTAGIAGCSGGDGSGGDGGETTTADGGDDGTGAVDLAIENVGASAWEVTSDASGSVAPTGTENPTMTFEVGRRYAVENGGWDVHPFALRAADDTPLLSQDADGEFEDDSAVDWVDDGSSFAFTVTQGLADRVDYYICTVHASMRGSVETA